VTKQMDVEKIKKKSTHATLKITCEYFTLWKGSCDHD